MAARALAAVAGRRAAGQSGFPAIASCRRRGGDQGHSSRSAHTQPEERNADHDAAAETVTAEQVEAALNSKNVEEVIQDGGRAAAVLPDEVVDDADAAWVPNQETGIFAPAEEAAGAGADGPHDQPGPSVLDQTVFVREEDMEDVERPAVDMANADGDDK
uniref:Uncharacterized protein n=1 Tax=Arundo donax TaxID=35708 RepID=A0A0A9FAF3_ARUDO